MYSCLEMFSLTKCLVCTHFNGYSHCKGCKTTVYYYLTFIVQQIYKFISVFMAIVFCGAFTDIKNPK